MRKLSHLAARIAGVSLMTLAITATAKAHCGSCSSCGSKAKQAALKQSCSLKGSSCSSWKKGASLASLNVVKRALTDGRFSILTKALDDVGLVAALEAEGPFTIFAPTDEAFRRLPEGTLESLSPDELTAILKAHVVVGKVSANDAVQAAQKFSVELDPLEGAPLAVKVVDGEVTIAGSKVISADLEASNGIIHVIDRVILPQVSS